MATFIAGWNQKGGPSTESQVGEYVELVSSFDADIVVLTEAYNVGDEKSEELMAASRVLLRDQNYESSIFPNQDADTRQDQRGVMVLNRIGGTLAVPRMATRNFGLITGHFAGMPDELDIAAIHLDDRSEASRCRQAAGLITRLVASDPSGERAQVIAGDLNTMNGRTAAAWRLRKLGPIARLLPKAEPMIGQKNYALRTKASHASRLAEMAIGTSFELLEQAGFMDTDFHFQPTFKSNGLRVQLDHIMYKNAHATDFKVIPERLGSDHNPIVTRLEPRVRF